jgi:hypothetical protein
MAEANISIEKSGSTRIAFDERRRKIFVELYNTLDGGAFGKLMQDPCTSLNYEKRNAWRKFTEAYNTVGNGYFHCNVKI